MASRATMHETDKDDRGEMFLTGRHQEIPRHPEREFDKTTLAAGAVLWRGTLPEPGEDTTLDGVEVACIHRPHYDDWSLAKGKVDPGESLVATAVREIKEETGYDIRLGKLLGKTIYPVKNTTKVVYYWTGEVTGGEFTPNSEVDEIRWLPLDEAKELLTYDLDRQVLQKAEKRFRLPATSRILYVRHGRAHDREKWSGDDNLRPLDKKGRHQSEMLVPMLAPFNPQRIFSAEPDRCQTTVAPLADELTLDVEVNELFGERAWAENQVACKQAFADVIALGGVSVICSQGGIMPDIIAWLSDTGRLPIDGPINVKKGGVWVLSFSGDDLTGADYIPSALPVR
ncbi:NUDIX hydrolase [Corynebacterium sanguinis]|uniref:NUDIX hydrolase n=1 Tax=Corynebacterium sanguinis TaxID=2594913 RepID=UPI00223BCE30|nr:bifunctional NUDIX hydrolase/histidine phosphatase family protein [Corynebacterium sanguinis]MCT1426612.1 NUDIX hydrolase [Corynebacterium sanguinis]MCT1629314.1 NUDIX hydrolase [Corynebacterium sanguinis]MCT2288731.1 NUDIX hydrolase [Corynebacterium sanguinis]